MKNDIFSLGHHLIHLTYKESPLAGVVDSYIQHVSSHVLWEYNTTQSHDSDTTKSKMLSNITLFWEFKQTHFVTS